MNSTNWYKRDFENSQRNDAAWLLHIALQSQRNVLDIEDTLLCDVNNGVDGVSIYVNTSEKSKSLLELDKLQFDTTSGPNKMRILNII